jgi:site-specific DNA-cytosine methylase
MFDTIGYNANYVRADTKFYYIPHTRTRVYLIACPQDLDTAANIPEQWEHMVKGMQRMASTPLEDYLLSTDDPRIHQAREDLARIKVQLI